MVKLRLRRKGKKFHPVYDIVAVDGRARRDGTFLEDLGYYDPNTTKSTIKINHERAIYWLNNGAQATDIVHNLLSYDGVLLRRALQFKGKSEAEINAELEKHQSVVASRWERRKKLRAARKIRRVREAEDAKKREEQEAEDAKRRAEEEAAAKAAAEAKAAEDAANAAKEAEVAEAPAEA
ncbi:MAG: 30S ribosomal protein S16 [Ignavibacteria bacterium]|jgi:small subunit ribosomal protein S16|nr:30S ribosomal protein S16 [Ignavibacteria bacterium]